MGMDVHGIRPTSAQGEYFRNNVWWWRPLWDYVLKVAGSLVPEGVSGHTNDGHGLNAEEARELGLRLTELLESGQVKAYAELRQAHLAALPDEVCTYCNGTGERNDQYVQGGCNGCKSTGKLRPIDTWYSFDEENVAEFASFCLSSGGFEIW